MIFEKDLIDFYQVTLKKKIFALSHRFHSTTYGMYAYYVTVNTYVHSLGYFFENLISF